MNLSLTNECTRRCEYCFQKQWYLESDVISKREMPLEMAKEIIDWYQNKTFSIMGGEPLLYSKLDDLLQYAYEKEKKVTIITNITVDTNIVKNVLDNYLNKPVCGFLINTDYTKEQKELFIKNYKLFYNCNEFSLSTTLLPDSDKIMESAERILELLDMLYDRSGVNVRISPMAPNHLSNYKLYDYTLDLSNFLTKIWEHGLCKVTFDCPVNGCEVHPDFIKELLKYKNNVKIKIESCGNNSCPFDVLIDGSIIYCSSCNFIRLNSYKDYKDNKDANDALMAKWREYWYNTELRCDYKNCGKFNPAKCYGLCAAKNKVFEQI